MSEFDSVAAARELRDSVPADQPHLWRLMDNLGKSFERERDRELSALARLRHGIDCEPQRS